MMLAMPGHGLCQVDMSDSQDPSPTWNDEQWKKAKDGLDYTDTPKEKKEKKEDAIEEQSEDNVQSNDSSDEWLKALFTSPLAKVIAILIIIGLLIFTIMRIMVANGVIKNKKLIQLEALSLDDIEDNLEESDLDKFLRHALEKGDYKTAVRILYLSVIQKLHANAWINWKKDKTNRDYLNEMRTRTGYTQFRNLTLAYEIVWYGDTTINAAEFERVNSFFSTYKKSLGNGEAK